MAAYYNEIDPFAAQWLRNLIAGGHIAPGDVDERSIEDVSAEDLRGYVQCHFFAGIGGWSYALRLAGWPDNEPVWTGSCPCQPFSVAGSRLGFADDRHLWPTFAKLIRECEPPVVFGEQVAAAADWIRSMHGDLEAMGRSVGCLPIEAASAGAPHRRDRIWFASHPLGNQQPWEKSRGREDRRVGRKQQLFPWYGGWKQALARFRVVDHGIPRSVAATDACRNAIVPQVAAEFISAYMETR